MIIGGNEDKVGDQVILRRVVQLSKSSRGSATLGIVTTASLDGDGAFHSYRRIFRDLGLERVVNIPIETRQAADDSDSVHLLRELGGLFFSGGDQLRITSVLGGTEFHHALLSEHAKGMMVAGTSAGASMMSDTMIVTGEAEESPTRNTVHMAPGMGLWLGAVIDQHFSQRGRIGRLLSALAQNPGILGVGLDEDTAIEVRIDEQTLEVWGSRTVTLLDGSKVTDTNASESRADRPLALMGVVLHVLPEHFRFDLRTRVPESPTASYTLGEDR